MPCGIFNPGCPPSRPQATSSRDVRTGCWSRSRTGPITSRSQRIETCCGSMPTPRRKRGTTPLACALAHGERRRQPMRSDVTSHRPDKTANFAFQVVGDLAAALSGRLMYIGDHLGLVKARANGNPITLQELAENLGLKEC